MKKVITLVVLLAFACTIILQDVMAAGTLVNEPASAGAKYSIAVLELESIGRISTSDAGRLTEILRSEFGGAGIFEVMSKSQLETMMQAAGLSMMGCSTIDCGLLAGRAAATKLVTFGSISKTSSTYDLEVQLVHVKSGQVVQSVRESFDGDYGALEAHMTTVAQKLMGTPRGPSPTAGSMAGQESSPQTAPDNTWDAPARESYSDDSEGSGNKALIIGLAAVGLVGGGILISQALKDDGTNNNNGNNPPPPGGTLPNPPTFP